MNNIWFISDTHFGHENIIKYEHRPFETVDEMDNIIIDNWNSVVKSKDTIYHLGDFCLTNDPMCYWNKLNGNKIIIRGNHDKKNKLPFEVNSIKEIKYNDKHIVLCHYPLESWNRSCHNSIHLHGHVHSRPINVIKNRFNMSVDVTGFKPVHIDEIISRGIFDGVYRD